MGEGFNWKGLLGGGKDEKGEGEFIQDEPAVQREETERAVAPVNTVENVDRDPAMSQGVKTERFTAEEMKSGVRTIVDSMKSTDKFFRAEDLMSKTDEIEKKLFAAGILKGDDMSFDYVQTLVREAVRDIAREMLAEESKKRTERKIA
jgi:hypothetical protein